MSVAVQRPWTADQFLAWAARLEGRYEFDGALPEVGIEMRVAELYQDVEFPPDELADAP